MQWIKLDPITRRRLQRFRRIKRGYYSFVILVVAIVSTVMSVLMGIVMAGLMILYGGLFGAAILMNQ